MRRGFGLAAAGVSLAVISMAFAGDKVGGPTIFVKAAQPAIQPGGSVVVEAFVQQVEDLHVYQVQLQWEGGDRGALSVESITVDKSRPDFVFGSGQVIDAADMTETRVGALRMSGGVAVTKPGYLATFILKATGDAQGTFRVNIRTGSETFLNASSAEVVPHQKGTDAQIVVGSPSRDRIEPRGKK